MDNDIDPEVQAVIVEEGGVLKDRVSYELLTVQTDGCYVSHAHTVVGAVWGEVQSLLVVATVRTPVEQLNTYLTNKWPLEKLVVLSPEDDRIHRDMVSLACTTTSWVYLNAHVVLGVTVEVITFKGMTEKFPHRKI